MPPSHAALDLKELTGYLAYLEQLGATGDITVTDLMGKNLFHQTAEEAGAVVEVNKHLAPGMYLVSLKTANGSLFIEKLVIQSK